MRRRSFLSARWPTLHFVFTRFGNKNGWQFLMLFVISKSEKVTLYLTHRMALRWKLWLEQNSTKVHRRRNFECVPCWVSTYKYLFAGLASVDMVLHKQWIEEIQSEIQNIIRYLLFLCSALTYLWMLFVAGSLLAQTVVRNKAHCMIKTTLSTQPIHWSTSTLLLKFALTS